MTFTQSLGMQPVVHIKCVACVVSTHTVTKRVNLGTKTECHFTELVYADVLGTCTCLKRIF